MMRVLISGGTGSLGQALIKHLLAHTDWRVIALSRDEYKGAVLKDRFPDPRVEFFLGDVRDRDRMVLACQPGLGAVVHAAALKRVDSVARDPDEVLLTNVMGSRNVLHAARECRVPKVLLVSSDKAAYPTTSYGVSKAMAEHLFRSFNIYSKPRGTISSVVRYGNVAYSRGSVLPVWEKYLEQGLALPLTDVAMTRFMITMGQAVELVMMALEAMTGGETFIPPLPMARMIDVGRALDPDARFVITGLRPGGEKLHETLITAEEAEEWGMKEMRSDGGPFMTEEELREWIPVARGCV